MSRPVVYETSARDPQTELPIVVVDTTALPSSEEAPSLERDVPGYVDALPKVHDFVLVFLASRAPQKPNIAWLHGLHASLDPGLKKRVRRVFVVHANWYTRALNRTLAPIVSPKFAKKMVHAKNLGELGRFIDITAIDMSPSVLIDDRDFSEDDELGVVRVPKHCEPVFGERLPLRPCNYWSAALAYLGLVDMTEQAFAPASRAPRQTRELTAVLLGAVKREQRLRLSDYGPEAVLGVLKEYMVSLPSPIVDLRAVPLPLVPTQEYIDRCILRLTTAAATHLRELVLWLQSVRTVDAEILGKSLGPAVTGLRRASRDEFAVAARFVMLLIEYWDPREEDARRTRRSASLGAPMTSVPPAPPAPRRVQTCSDHERSTRGADAPSRPRVLTELAANRADTGRRGEPDKIAAVQNSPSVRSRGAQDAAADSSRARTAVAPSAERRTALQPGLQQLRPRDLPSEVPAAARAEPRVPHRKAFGRIAEIIKVYDESQWA